MFYAWKLNFVLLLRHFLVSISSTVRASVYWQICFNAVFSTSKQLRWTYVDSTFIFNQISTLKYRRNSFNAPSTFFCQRWSNVNKHTLGQLSIPTKFQRWNNVGSATLSRHDSIHVVSTLFCQLWNNIDKCKSNFHFQPKVNAETTSMYVDDQHCFNVNSTLMCLLGKSFANIFTANSLTEKIQCHTPCGASLFIKLRGDCFWEDLHNFSTQ